MPSDIQVFTNSFQITRFVTICPELFPVSDTNLALSNWITSSGTTEHMAVLKCNFEKVNVCGVYTLLSSHFPLAHHWGADILNFLLKRKENNSFYPLCNSFITGWAFSLSWIYFCWSGALMVVQSQIPAMTENMSSHVFQHILACLTLYTLMSHSLFPLTALIFCCFLKINLPYYKALYSFTSLCLTPQL